MQNKEHTCFCHKCFKINDYGVTRAEVTGYFPLLLFHFMYVQDSKPGEKFAFAFEVCLE